MKRIFFFATQADIVPVLKRLEGNAPLKFVEIGSFTDPNLPIYLESSEIPNPGIATHETGSASDSYMVSHRDIKNHMHEFVDDSGQRRWLLNNGDNEESARVGNSRYSGYEYSRRRRLGIFERCSDQH